MAHDDLYRALIRKNVGHLARPVRSHAPRAIAAPWLSGAFPRERPGPTPPGQPPSPLALIFPGHSYAITLAPGAASRRVGVTPRIGFPYQLRAIAVTGDVAATEAFSFRLLDSDDNDTGAVADPTGSDILEPIGDLIGAEDPGIHAGLTNGPVHYEPWYRRTATGGFIKLKVHNAVAAARRITVALDLDELPT